MSESIDISTTWQKYWLFYDMVSAILRRKVHIIGKERQTRNSLFGLFFCTNNYNPFKLQSYKDTTYDAFKVNNFTAPAQSCKTINTDLKGRVFLL